MRCIINWHIISQWKKKCNRYAGSYNATFTPFSNYQWSDGTTVAKTVAWSIGKAAESSSLNKSSLAVSTGTMARLGVINSPDYWQQATASGKAKYLDRLLVKAAEKITKAGPRSSTVANAVGTLVAADVIDTPDYWLANYSTFPSLDALLCAMGGAVK